MSAAFLLQLERSDYAGESRKKFSGECEVKTPFAKIGGEPNQSRLKYQKEAI